MKNKYKMILFGVMCVMLLAPLTAYASFELPLDPLPESETASDEPSTTSDSSNPTAASTTTSDKSQTEEKSTNPEKTVSLSESAASRETSDSDGKELPIITPDGRLVETSETTSTADHEPSEVSRRNNAPENTNRRSSSSDNSNAPQRTDNSSSSENNNAPQRTDNSSSSENSNAPQSTHSSFSSENSSDTPKSDNSLSDENDSSREQAVSHTDSSERSESNGNNALPIIIASICGAIVIAAGIVFAIIRKAKK